MESRKTIKLLASPLILTLALAARAEMTTQPEALTIAQNYISLVLNKDGDWGGSASAQVASIEEFKRGQRTLGYFCRVNPHGYLVVSLHKELAPVKVYSVDSELDPELDQGMTDVIKIFMERMLDAVEADLGRPIDPTDRFDEFLETNYRPAWDVLVDKGFDGTLYREGPKSRSVGMNYQEGEVLLRTAWSQGAPWNEMCPFPSYWDPIKQQWVYYECDDTGNGRTWVGCVATAAAQIMNYWEWPPYGEDDPYDDGYDWNNMCNKYVSDGSGWWNDENGNPVTQAQIDAVAELSREIGVAVDMDYGCSGSSAYHEDMETAYEQNFRYSSSCNIKERCCDIWGHPYYTAFEWYELMMNQFNLNRPVQYGIPGHSLNADGWKMEQIGDDFHWYHMNYGWGGGGFDPNDPEWQGYTSSNAWFALDAHPGGDTEEDDLIRTIIPACAIGGWMEGSYGVPSPINARYFDQDTEGNNASFAAGIWFQALEPGVLIRGTGTGGDAITFNGAPGDESILYHSADFDTYTRIRISDGSIKLHGGGEMVIH